MAISRRMFCKVAMSSAVLASPAARGGSAASSEIPTRALGRTGERVSLLGLGGYHIGVPPESESTRIIHKAIDSGVTFLDNCWDYHDGGSEERMGRALAGGYRNRVFLMTKIDGQTKAVAAKQLDESLRRLRTDRSTSCSVTK